MIVSHYQKKNILLFCRSSPINHNLLPGKSTARCSFLEWSRHLQPSATISNGRCADWMEKADWILLTLYATICEDWAAEKPSWTKRFRSIGCAIWAATIDLHDCATTVLLLVPMVHQKYISSPYQNVCPGSWYLFLSPKRILQTSASVALFTV